MKNHQRLILFPLLIPILIVLVFSACTLVDPTATPAVQSSVTFEDETITATASPTNTPLPSLGIDPAALRGIEVNAWHAFAGEAKALFDELVPLFNSTNEWGITVTTRGYGDYLTLDEAMQAGSVEGETPQLLITLPEQALVWQAEGLVVDLGPYRGDPDFGLSVEEQADFPAVFWTSIGAPAQRSARFLYYNQTWAHELGFTAPPLTPEEFRQQACAANASFKTDPDPEDDGFGGWVVDDNWQTVYAWMLAFGGNPVDEGSFTINSEENEAALVFLKSLYDENCAWLLAEGDPYQAFAAGKALFVTGDLVELNQETHPGCYLHRQASFITDFISDQFPDLEAGTDYNFFVFPPIEEEHGNTLLVAGDLFAMFNDTEQSRALVQYMLSAPAQAIWAEVGGFIATKNGVKLLEYNARFGDPEAMNILPLLKTDFVSICRHIIAGTLDQLKIEFARKATVCKYVVPKGYGLPADHSDAASSRAKIEVGDMRKARLYYSSVDKKEDGLYLSSSRAIGIVGIADTLDAARKIAEKGVKAVHGPVAYRNLRLKPVVQQ